jgi:hypothetical protein
MYRLGVGQTRPGLHSLVVSERPPEHSESSSTLLRRRAPWLAHFQSPLEPSAWLLIEFASRLTRVSWGARSECDGRLPLNAIFADLRRARYAASAIRQLKLEILGSVVVLWVMTVLRNEWE